MRTAVGTTFTVFTFFNTSASYMLLDHSKTAVLRLRPTLSEARSPFSRFQRTPQLTPLPGGGAAARLLKRIASAPSWQSTSSMLSAAISALVAVSVAGAALLAALVRDGFAVASFSEDVRNLEDVYFAQVGHDDGKVYR
jgi:hypothetical protein